MAFCSVNSNQGSREDFSLEQLASLFGRAGAVTVYLKRLAINDNSKNQIYIATGSLSELNLLPTHGLRDDSTTLKAALDFYWLSEGGTLERAPHAQLILYDQYPEVRLSGFLRGTRNAPGYLFRLDRNFSAGRLLFLGVTTDRKTIAYAASATSRIAYEVLPVGSYRHVGAFEELPFTDPLGELLEKLREIHDAGPVAGIRFGAGGQIIENTNQNASGVTLETLLNIPSNSRSAPDYKGTELKVFPANARKRPVTLMTPEPTGGLYRDLGIAPFLHRFGRLDPAKDRLYFTGRHVAGVRCPSTGLTLRLSGFEQARSRFDLEQGAIQLLSDEDENAAEWRFAKLAEHWMRKHPRVIFVPYTRVDGKYHYGPDVYLGEGTDFLRVLKSTAAGEIFYDPGNKLEKISTSKPASKKRNQFRVYWTHLHKLYERFGLIPLVQDSPA